MLWWRSDTEKGTGEKASHTLLKGARGSCHGSSSVDAVTVGAGGKEVRVMPRGSLAMGTGRSLGARNIPDFQGLGGLHQGNTERSGKCDRCHVVA